MEKPKEVKQEEQEDVVELKLETVNLILNLLTNHPWKEVNELISKVHREIGIKPPYKRVKLN